MPIPNTTTPTRFILALLIVLAFASSTPGAAQTPTLNDLFTFTGASAGTHPFAGLIQASNGTLYGTTRGDAAPGDWGAVFAITTTGAVMPLYLKSTNEEGIVWSLERIEVVEAMHGDARKAARLLGAASIMRERQGIPLTPLDKQDWDEALDILRAKRKEPGFAEEFEAGRAHSREQGAEGRAALEDDAVFNAAWQEGRAMTIEKAIRFSLSDASV